MATFQDLPNFFKQESIRLNEWSAVQRLAASPEEGLDEQKRQQTNNNNNDQYNVFSSSTSSKREVEKNQSFKSANNILSRKSSSVKLSHSKLSTNSMYTMIQQIETTATATTTTLPTLKNNNRIPYYYRNKINYNNNIRKKQSSILNMLPVYIIITLSIITLTISHPNFALMAKSLETLPAAAALAQQQQNTQERNDPMQSLGESGSGQKIANEQQASKTEQSIVASLSSAVASAAAAAAVAAAKAHSGLSGGDARSLAAASAQRSGSGSSQATAANRSPALQHLAIKLADSIPEVPYNILHNMKKLDHAAPFYNVPNKVLGSPKESSVMSSAGGGGGGGTSLLGQALMSVAHSMANVANAGGSGGGAGFIGAGHHNHMHHNRLGGAAIEQLGQLFRSPLWKRLADGYDGFTSEFRSLFRAPSHSASHSHSHSPSNSGGGGGGGNSPIKASINAASSSSSPMTTGKILRDISVPALLVLLASSLSGNENNAWRPVRTRRKSLALPTSLIQLDRPLEAAAAAVESMSTSGSEQRLQQQQQQVATGSNEQTSQNGFDSIMQQQVRSSSAAAATASPSNGDINLQQQQQQQQVGMEPTSSGSNWMQQQQQATSGQINYHNLELPNNLSPSQLQQQQQYASSAAAAAAAAALPLPLHFNNYPMNFNVHNQLALPNALKRLGEYNIIADEQQQQQQQQQLEKRSDSSYLTPLTSGETNSMHHERQAGKLLSLYSKLFRDSNANKRSSASSFFNTNDHSYPSYSLINSPSSSSSAEAGKVEQQNFVGKQLLNAKRLLTSAIATSNANNNYHFEDATKTLATGGASAQRRQAVGLAEQRDLTKLLPESWREVVKRTMSTVQQQANAQWKVVEGQLANWVQDKLKNVAANSQNSAAASSSSSASSANAAAAAASAAASAPSPLASATGGSPVPAAVSNIIASVSSSALNILGLNSNNSGGNKKNSPTAAAAAANVSTDRSSTLPIEIETNSNSAVASSSSGANSQRGR